VIALYWLTFAVELLGVVLALWLGIYLVSLSPKYPIAWLTALTLLSLGGLFFNVLLAINPPPLAYNQPAWLHFMLPFWPQGALEGTTNAWMQGWSVIAAFAFWYHATVLMRPGKLTPWRITRILIGYLLASLAVWVHTTSPILSAEPNSSPLYLNNLHVGAHYPLIGVLMGLLALLSLESLYRTAREAPSTMPRRQFLILLYATLFAVLGIPISILGSGFHLPVPMVVFSVIEVISVSLFGFGAARYSAIVQGRTIQRDFIYNLTLLACVVGVYLLASFFLVRIYLAPAIILVIVPVLAVLTHSLMTFAHRIMDRFFYQRQTRQLRTNLQRLVRLAGEGVGLDVNLERALDTLCTSVRASCGLIFIFEGEEVRQAATVHWAGGAVKLIKTDLTCDDVVQLAPGKLPDQLQEMVLLIPLYTDDEQLGVILLGRPINSTHFAPEEVERLMDHSDRIADMISVARRKAQSLAQIAELAKAHPISTALKPQMIPDEMIEKALQNISDYTFLADSALAELKLVQAHLPSGEITYLDRGKTVHAVILQALEKLRPSPALPHDPLPREWYPYQILCDAYLEELNNRDIMMRLYISEGTFNRTRRAAVHSLARTLSEMETAIP
jgi:hypothetical protein